MTEQVKEEVWYRECRNTEGCGVRLEVSHYNEEDEVVPVPAPDIGSGTCPVCETLMTEWKPGPAPEVDA